MKLGLGLAHIYSIHVANSSVTSYPGGHQAVAALHQALAELSVHQIH